LTNDIIAMTTKVNSQEPLPPSNGLNKRKRIDSTPSRLHVQPAPTAAQARLEINYLARQDSNDLPIASNTHQSLREILDTLIKYSGVLERNESVAANLGCKPLGPILLKRFERLFDGPVKLIDDRNVKINWIRVAELAKEHPNEFRLVDRQGLRVCQFSIDGYEAEISEEDYHVLMSGMAFNMMPPQPIEEDEDKELGILETLNTSLSEVITNADSVSGVARHVKHRFEQRRKAILAKKEASATVSSVLQQNNPAMPYSHQSPLSGPEPREVSAGPSNDANGRRQSVSSIPVPATYDQSVSPPANPSMPYADVLLEAAAYSSGLDKRAQQLAYNTTFTKKASPSSDEGPLKAEIEARIDHLARGEPIRPPCDRCRRLEISCIKNLSACEGCTKKHARCAWLQVTPEELQSQTLHSRGSELATTNEA
jgi:hypothetical protein